MEEIDDEDESDKFWVHFDNCSSEWDEVFEMEDFERGRIKPFYTETRPHSKALELELAVYHRWHDEKTNSDKYFGQPHLVQCHVEWSLARAGAHILAQSARFLQRPPEADDGKSSFLVDRAHGLACDALSSAIRVLVQADREHVSAVMGDDVYQTKDPQLAATMSSTHLQRQIRGVRNPLPFEFLFAEQTSPHGQLSSNPSTRSVRRRQIPDHIHFPSKNFLHNGLHWKTFLPANRQAMIPPMLHVPAAVGKGPPVFNLPTIPYLELIHSAPSAISELITPGRGIMCV